MNLDELWIGDLLQIKSTSVKGKFAGIENGQAIIDIGGEKIMVASDDLMVLDEKFVVEEKQTPVPKEIHIKKKGFDLEEAAHFKPVLDLHMKSLNPIGIKINEQDIMSFQLDACTNFLEQAGAFNIDKVKVIHGKGKGTLKNRVASLLKFHHFVRDFEPNIEGGSFDVYLK